MPPKAKTEKISDEKAQEILLEYLKKTNRPYNAVDLVANLHNVVAKTIAVKALNALHEKGLIHAKTYGKQVIYVAKQADENAPTSEEIVEVDSKINSLTEEKVSLSDKTKQIQTQLNSLASSLTLEQLQKKYEELKRENEIKQKRLDDLQEGKQVVSEEERITADKELERMRKEWKWRKAKFDEIWDQIAENAPDPKGLLLELGIETDQQHNVSLAKDPLEGLC
ncbi:hypothetical protein HK098_001322 [Nowakowskiella sp. JEL0407]|nr:hypothetical protein HK098_001322 [Nowakowskiella sp. JEL0407]